MQNIKNKKNIAIIPARGGSKSIPRKSIIDFAGKPLLAWTIEQAIASSFIDEVYVTSDSKDILKIAADYGAKIIQRPRNISSDTASSESALLHALSQLRENIDYIVFLQATSPLRKSDDIDNAIRKIIKDKADSLLSLTEAQEFVWRKSKGKINSVTFDYKNRRRHQELEKIYYENGSIYVFKPKILQKYKNRLGGKITEYIMQPWQRADIDDYLSFEWCQWLYYKYSSDMAKKDILSKIELIAYDFDGVMTDNKVFVDQIGNEAVCVNRSDGLAISLIKAKGIPQVILSSEKNSVVKRRADKLNIPCLSGDEDKKSILKKYLDIKNINKDNVIFVGNDINDKEVMRYVGCPIAPNDACKEIKDLARIITKSNGGGGIVRELFDMLSRAGVVRNTVSGAKIFRIE